MFELKVRGLVAIACVMAVSQTCAAQDKGQVKDQAKSMASVLRQAGEPMDRCSLGAKLVDGPIITSVSDGTPLQLGDRLLTVNKIDVAGKTGDNVVRILRGIGPGSTVEITLERNSAQQTIAVVCENSRPYIETILAGLDAASRGKFDECVAAFSQRNDLGAFGAAMRLQCKSLTKNPNEHDLASLGYEATKQAIAEANWAPNLRPAVINGLRQAEGQISRQLGNASFQTLVEATQRWPGGENMFKQSEPDMSQFRRAAEKAVVSRLIDPESARIEFPYGFMNGTWKPVFQKKIEGYWTCGRVNAKNRMGGYTGSTSFVVVLNPSGGVQYVELGTGKDFDILSAQCANSAHVLPPAPAEFSSDSSNQGVNTGGSIADEIKKLVELKESGALTEAEFQAAKQRMLAPASP